MNARPLTRNRPRTAAALALVGALMLAGCSSVSSTSSSSSGASAGSGGAATGPGVTAEPCPKAVDKEKGCIYLGVLSDLTEGPFTALAVPITEAQRNYWKKVNEDGGIGDYEVDIETYTRDTKYQAAEHAKAYQQIRENVLGLAQTLGTIPTEAILPDMDADDMIGVPASWWSGNHFTSSDKGLLLESGYSYCTEAMVGLDWFTDTYEKPQKVVSVGYPGDYGSDSGEGVKRWAEANGVEVTAVETGPNQVTGSQDAAVAAVKKADPDVVVLATGPGEAAELVGKLVGGGYDGRFVGSLPTWNQALLESAAADALIARYNHLVPFEQWDGTSKGAEAMRASLGGKEPKNAGYIIGWIMSYPMHAALLKAEESGKLTREGLRAAVDGLQVTYDGAAPEVTYGRDGKDAAQNQVRVYAPDKGSPLGVKSAGPLFTGTTLEKVTYDAACSATG